MTWTCCKGVPFTIKKSNFVICMEFIDTHTHISDEAFSGCREEIVSRALKAGVGKMIQADIDSTEREGMFSVVGKYSGILFPMLGLYPGSVRDDWKEEIDRMLPYRSKGVVAIGEIGLDYHYGADFKEQQKEAFRAQLELAASWNLPVNIHLREATDDFFSIMDSCSHLGLRGDIHAFSGSYETFTRLQKYGDWYVGIGGVVTFRNASIARDIVKIPTEKILLETDAPYLAPVPYRGTRNESANIPLIAGHIAALKGISLEEIAETTTDNAKKLFGI